MRGNKKIIVGGVLLIAIVLVAVGFAAIGSKTLTISGNTTATPNSANFSVKFTGTPTTGGAGTTTATINGQDQLKATMNVTGLTAKGDVATATYTISNESPVAPIRIGRRPISILPDSKRVAPLLLVNS